MAKNDTRTLTVSLVAKSELFKRGLNDASKSLRGFKAGMGRFTAGIVSATAVAAKTIASVLAGITASITATIAAVTKIGSDFETSINKSFAIMGDLSEKNKQAMTRAALETSKVVTFTASEIAEGYFFLASAGLDAQQSIQALPQVAKFAQAGMFDLSTATTLAADAQSALGLKSADAEQNLKNLTRVTDVLIKANTIANANAQQFSEALTSKAGAALRFANKTIEEGVAVLAAFADQGVKGTLAGERLAIMLQQLPRVAQANADAFRWYNISIFDAQGNMRNFADIAKNFETSLAGVSVEQRNAIFAQLGLTEVLASGVAQLMGASEAIANYEQQLGQAAGFTEDVAAKQLNTFAAQLALVRNRIYSVAIQIYQRLEPALRDVLIPAINSLIDSFEQLDVISKIIPIIDNIVINLNRAIKALNFFNAVWLTIKGTVLSFFTIFASGWVFIFRGIKKFGLSVIETFQRVFDFVLSGVQSLLSAVNRIGSRVGINFGGEDAIAAWRQKIQEQMLITQGKQSKIKLNIMNDPFFKSLIETSKQANEDAVKAWETFNMGEENTVTRAISNTWGRIKESMGKGFEEGPVNEISKRAEEMGQSFEDMVSPIVMLPETLKDATGKLKDLRSEARKDPGQFTAVRSLAEIPAIGSVTARGNGVFDSSAAGFAAQTGNQMTGADNTTGLLQGILMATQATAQNTARAMVPVAG